MKYTKRVIGYEFKSDDSRDLMFREIQSQYGNISNFCRHAHMNRTTLYKKIWNGRPFSVAVASKIANVLNAKQTDFFMLKVTPFDIKGAKN